MKIKEYKILFYIVLFLLIITCMCFCNKKTIQTRCMLNKVEMRESSKTMGNKKSYGMFAKNNIKKNELIELAPILIEEPSILHKSGKLSDYYFIIKNKGIFPLGYAGMYNHSNNPNALALESSINFNDRTMEITASKDIKANEEITISYGDNYWKSRNIKPV